MAPVPTFLGSNKPLISSIASHLVWVGWEGRDTNCLIALSCVLAAASHANTMMWIGQMQDCPLDLAGQGQILKHGRIARQGGRKPRRSWSGQKATQCQLLLFHKTLLLCRTRDNLSEPNNPHLCYENHIRYILSVAFHFCDQQ